MPHWRETGPEILIAGGGIAGSVAALLLARQGRHVGIIDPFPVYPPDFRCEKLTSNQLTQLRRLGLLDLIAPFTTPVRHAVVARGGRAIDARPANEMCFRYDALVNAIRRAWPRSVTLIEGRAAGIEAGPDGSTVTLTDGRGVNARLVVLATGPGEKLRAQLGLKRRLVRANHSLCIGFDLVAGNGGPLSPRSLTYYGERAGDGVAFMTVFPYADRTRCNLFAYLDRAAPEILAVRRDTLAGLRSLMPGLPSILGRDARLHGHPELRITDLYDIPQPERDGIVLIGEAFRPSCPVTGTGVSRVLNDCERLCGVHIPRWLETPGMSREKIAQFYADPQKQAVDAASAVNAEKQRRFALERGIEVAARRLAALLKARVHFALSRQPPAALVLRPAPPHSAAAGTGVRGAPLAAPLAPANPRMTV